MPLYIQVIYSWTKCTSIGRWQHTWDEGVNKFVLKLGKSGNKKRLLVFEHFFLKFILMDSQINFKSIHQLEKVLANIQSVKKQIERWTIQMQSQEKNFFL